MTFSNFAPEHPQTVTLNCISRSLELTRDLTLLVTVSLKLGTQSLDTKSGPTISLFKQGVDRDMINIYYNYEGKGDTLDRGNYSGLKMTDQAMKLSEHVLEASICDRVNINGMQFGFVSGRGTTDAIFNSPSDPRKVHCQKEAFISCFC